MKNTLMLMFLVVCFGSVVQCQTTPTAAVATVKAQMLNPDSFVLESIGTYSTKKITDAVFMSFRSQNHGGGYSIGCASVGQYKGKMRLDLHQDSDLAGAEICREGAKDVSKWLDVKDFK